MTERMTAAEYREKAGVKPSKYRNKRVTSDGHTFDSKGEAKRWGELRVLEQVGEISHLERQVRIPLRGKNGRVADYIADFRYRELDAGGNAYRIVVEDFKGVQTPEFKLKAKLFEDNYGFPIRITGAA